MSRITLSIFKDTKPSSSFRFSQLNTNKIVFAGFNKAKNASRRVVM